MKNYIKNHNFCEDENGRMKKLSLRNIGDLKDYLEDILSFGFKGSFKDGYLELDNGCRAKVLIKDYTEENWTSV